MQDSLQERKLLYLNEIAHAKRFHPEYSEEQIRRYIEVQKVHIQACDMLITRCRKAVDLVYNQ
jgi:hypothetical protein